MLGMEVRIPSLAARSCLNCTAQPSASLEHNEQRLSGAELMRTNAQNVLDPVEPTAHAIECGLVV